MTPRRIGQRKKIRRVRIPVDKSRIKPIEEIGDPDPKRHPFSFSERNRDFFFDARISHDICGHLSLVVSPDDLIQIINHGEWKSRSRFHRERRGETGRQREVSPADKPMRTIPIYWNLTE